MYLKNITLSGFKSFARTTVFEFPTPITGVVGPNGSGKSNVVEAIRWVLGEQSIKSLRGKKGEDLIFNGSEKAARLGRAEVKLVFDNSKKHFPFEFDDVIISRRVVRDGTNEYLLNGSEVRLKDIFELLSSVSLGSTGHHVISQGEVDRILWSSPEEREAMVEDALGLREYHIKARDAGRRLEEAEVNIRQVEAQRREIQPHLKFLRSQADKIEAHASYSKELEAKSREFAAREHQTLARWEEQLKATCAPLAESKLKKEKRVKEIQGEIQKEEKEFSRVPERSEVRGELEALEEKRRTLDRELGKIEGLLLVARRDTGSGISPAAILHDLREALLYVDELMAKDSFESLKSGLKDVKMRLEALVKLCGGQEKGGGDSEFLGKKKEIAGELRAVEEKIAHLKSKREEDEAAREDIMTDLREREHALREEERELEALNQELREIQFDEEKLRARREEFAKFLESAHLEKAGGAPGAAFENDEERSRILRAIERLRIKLEEAGGIDETVVKEYEETLARDAFLVRELEDLKKAKKSLEDLSKELARTLKDQFIEGLAKINNEFGKIFKKVFGGGRASLVYIKPEKRENEAGEIEETKSGIEISLDLPGKRIRSLDLLSGGERALTSVALLFAMSTVNPPPFLVLDETDAALDEVNSQRYGDLLEILSKKTQLVVVTHNRETMRRCGVLYGVTLGEDAISRVLSLKFEEAKELVGAER